MKRLALLPTLFLMLACAKERAQPVAAAAPPPRPGSAVTGKELIDQYACLACHQVPGFEGEFQGSLGPSLAQIGSRALIAGRVPNNVDSMIAYLQNPQTVDPENRMPSMGLTEEEAQHITAYLFTLK